MKRCQGCAARIQAGGFCEECRRSLLRAQTPVSGVRSLYSYQGILRQTILRAKVKNDVLALQALCELFVGNPQILECAHECDVLVPAPSSLWGRLRGRFDIAQALALELSKQVDRPVRLMPFRHYMSFGKRAGKNLSSMANRSIAAKSSQFADQRVMLIDDIFTTGWTMRHVGLVLKDLGATEVRSWTVGMAFQETDRSQSGNKISVKTDK